MNFEDICWLDALFEKMMTEARKAKNKQAVVAIIRNNHLLIKERKIDNAVGKLHNC